MEVHITDNELVDMLHAKCFTLRWDKKCGAIVKFNSNGILTYELGNPVLLDPKNMSPLSNLTFKKWDISP